MKVVLVLLAIVLVAGSLVGGHYWGWRQGASDMKAYYEKVVSDQKTSYEAYITDLKASHEEAITDLKASHEKAITDQKAFDEKTISDQRAYYEKALADLGAKYEKEIADLKTAQKEALDKAKKESYNEGYQDGQSLAPVHDPIYAEMQWFLQEDVIGNSSNLNVVYNNPFYADTVKTNAEDQYIRCFIVLVQFTSGQYHVIVAFKTTDQGIKYVEPQNDREVTLLIGQSYSQQNGFTLKSNDIIQGFTVFD